MKALKKDLQSVAKALKSLTTKTERISKRIDKLAKAQASKKAKARPKPKPKKKARVKGRPVRRKVAKRKVAKRKVAKKRVAKKRVAKKKVAKKKIARKKAPARKKVKVSGSDAVLKIIKRSKKGVGTAVLKQKTGFKEKKIRDAIYRLKKQRKIKSVQKGFYVAI
jgi:adenylate kinase